MVKILTHSKRLCLAMPPSLYSSSADEEEKEEGGYRTKICRIRDARSHNRKDFRTARAIVKVPLEQVCSEIAIETRDGILVTILEREPFGEFAMKRDGEKRGRYSKKGLFYYYCLL